MANEWFYAACGKVQFNDADPFIISFEDTIFRDLADQEGVNFEELAILAILSPFFTAAMESYDNGWSGRIPPLNFSKVFSAPPAMIGSVYDELSTPNYPSDRIGLGCFTKDEMRESLSSEVPLGSSLSLQEWRDLVRQTPFDELQALVDSANADAGTPSSPLVISGDRATLRLTPCTQQEIADLDVFGGLDAPRKDIFDFVKARLTNTNSALDEKGLAPAKYYADGDYIEFVSECSLSVVFSEVVGGLPSE